MINIRMRKDLSAGKVQRKIIKEDLVPAYWEEDKYFVIDQIKLPAEIIYIECRTWKDVAETIMNMNLRGAPLIGAAASAGVALAFKNVVSDENFEQILQSLLTTRPTAVNLKNVLDETVTLYNSLKGSADKFRSFRDFSLEVHKRDLNRNRKMGDLGSQYLETLFPDGGIKVLTHCNAGALATCGYGTALGVVRALHSKGLLKHVWVDETRPYLQGARLTAFEMAALNIEHTVITDSTAAWMMKRGEVDVIITGADRVAANGDMANKIGTYSLAVNARYHKIPFVGVMPLETFDMKIDSGEKIVIEERSDKELLSFNGKRISPEGSKGLHLGFDVVPAELLNALVTEKGVVSGLVNAVSIKGLFNE